MIGKQATIPDIELQELVQPTDLYCNEELSEEEATEEEPSVTPFKIIVACGCGAKLRLYVLATEDGIRQQQQLLLGDVQLLCPDCRDKIRNE